MSGKAGLTAWERWELASFDQPSDAPAGAPRAAKQEPPAESAVPPALTFSEEELAALREAAYNEAFAEGREAGHKEGYAAGHLEGTDAARAETEPLLREQAEQLAQLASHFDEQLQELDATVAEDLMQLALEIARKVVVQTVALRPEVVVDVIHQALAHLPVQHAAIHLHPEDASLARSYAGDLLTHAGHRIHENAKLKRGDVMLDAGGSHLDASIATRWRRVLESMGRSDAWLVTAESDTPAAGHGAGPADADDPKAKTSATPKAAAE